MNRNKCDKENRKGQQMFLFYFVCVWIFHISITALFNTAWHSFLLVESNTHTPILQVIFIAHEYHIITDDIKLCMILLGMQGSLFDVYK